MDEGWRHADPVRFTLTLYDMSDAAFKDGNLVIEDKFDLPLKYVTPSEIQTAINNKQLLRTDPDVDHSSDEKLVMVKPEKIAPTGSTGYAPESTQSGEDNEHTTLTISIAEGDVVKYTPTANEQLLQEGGTEYS